MLLVSAEDIRRVLSFEHLVEALRGAHLQPRMPGRDLIVGDGPEKFFVRAAGLRGLGFGSKLITVFPDNPRSGNLPSVQAVFVLFGGEDGRPRAVMDGTEITYWKTAADSALGSALLSREDSARFLMVGAGSMAPWLVRAHLAVRPNLREVAIWNRTAERAKNLAARLSAEGIPAEPARDLAQAVRAADIVCCATMANEPLIAGEWVSNGTHLDLVGGWTPAIREADDEVMRRSRLFVDNRESAFDGVGDILIPIENGTIVADDVLADLYDLVSGAEGREGADDVTVFKNAGGAHLDLMTANAILDRLDSE